MVLVHQLDSQEIQRHKEMILAYAKTTMGSNSVDVSYLGNGQEKGVYRVRFDENPYLAIAARRDRRTPKDEVFKGSLFAEYTKLHKLHNDCPQFFPAPIAHYSPQDRSGDLMIMELLPHRDLSELARTYPETQGIPRKTAHAIGITLGEIVERTGMYPTEPHDGNILGMILEDKVDLRYVDVIQFQQGSIEDAGRVILANKGERPEAFRFIHLFREGMTQGIAKARGVSKSEVYPELDFMAEYNPIF